MLVTPAIPTTPTRSEHPAKAYCGMAVSCAVTVKLPAKVHTTLYMSHEPAPAQDEGHAVCVSRLAPCGSAIVGDSG